MGLVGSKKLKPGEETELQVTLDPLGKSGPTKKLLIIRTNDPIQPKTTVPVLADVLHWIPGSSTETLEGALFRRSECMGCHAIPARGKTGAGLYAAVCAMCHGSLEAYAPTIAPEDAAANALRSWIADGRAGEGMPGYSSTRGGPLTEDQIDSLVEAVLQAR